MTTTPPLKTLRALPGVQSVDLRDGRLWVRFALGATSKQRDAFAKQITGREPVLASGGFHDLTPPRREPVRSPARNTGGKAA